jgi:threonine synthase
MSLRYISTRGGVPPCGFEDVLFHGLAADGGLFVPESWPRFEADELAALQGRSYQEVAVRLLSPFVAGALAEDELAVLIERAYAGFAHQAVVPLKQLSANDWLLELFHGPTLAFKDVALQLLGLLFEHFLKRRERAITIVGATSGDTGAAAIAGAAGRSRMRIVILHPKGRVSEVQRRQMTTVSDANVHNVAIEGTFDDCQALVKALFNDPAARQRLNLAAINSINWGRIMAQAVYYVTASLALGGPWRKLSFAVPTGNFGDVYAGYVAAKMGLPVDQLIVATNRNDILARFFQDGVYRAGEVHPTISPSMDIQVASNFERLLFDLYDRNPDALTAAMAGFAETGELAAGDNLLGRAREKLDAGRADEAATRAEMRRTLDETGLLIDPHSAVARHVGRVSRLDPAVPLVTLATAHPAKFPDAVEQATGVRPALPPHMADLMTREERFATLPNDVAALKDHIDKLPLETA